MFKHLNIQPETQKRLLTSVAIIAVLALFLGLQTLTPWVFDILVFALCIAAISDIVTAKKLPSKGVRGYYMYFYAFFAYIAFVLCFVNSVAFWIYILLEILILAVFCLYVFLLNYMDKDFNKKAQLKKQKLARACLGTSWEFLKVAVYPALLILSLVPINHMGSWASVTLPESGVVVDVPMLGLFGLLLVLVVSTFTDTFAYIVGCFFIKRVPNSRKLCPKITPKKTVVGAVAGLFGGIIGAMLVVLICSSNTALREFLTNKIGFSFVTQLVFCTIGLVGSIATQAGDLYASWLKRKNNAKDFGKYLPGHGGAMDRLDGISFNALFIFLVMIILVAI